MLVAVPLKNETPKAFRAFKMWIDEGTDREVRSVARRLSCSVTNLIKWVVKYKWHDRLAQIMAAEAEREAEAATKAANEYARKREALRLSHEKRMMEHAEKMSAVVSQMLSMPLVQMTKEFEKKDAKGRTIAVTQILEPVNFNMGQAARMLTELDRAVRLCLGMPTGRAEVTGKDGEPLKLPTTQPITNIVIQRDAQSDKVAKIYYDYFRKHSDHPQASRFVRDYKETSGDDGDDE